ncbi:MAG: hypothetical protein R3B09_26020 [Nannocystaceae bacterium]
MAAETRSRAPWARAAAARISSEAGRRALVLALAGLCFGKAQVAAIRELGSLLYGEEVVLWLISSVALAGAALGYRLGGALSRAALGRLLIAGVLVQFASPALVRLAVAGLCALRGGTGPELLGVAVLAAAAASLPFCALLPAYLDGDAAADRVAALRVAYTAELIGFAAGSGAGLALGASPTLSFAVHALALVALLGLALPLRRVALLGLALAAAAILTHQPLGTWSLEQVYIHKHRLPGARVRWSVDSSYQRVEVVDAPGRGRMLYLDGLRDLDSRSLATLNHYLARVPARLLPHGEALLLGNGTLSLVPELAARSRAVTTVEIDPAVVDAGARFFTPGAPLDRLGHWRLRIADGKAFLAGSERRFDLIVVDLPSPLTLGEAYLHTEEFYRLCRARLRPGGALAVQLSGDLGSPRRTPARVVAGLRRAFPEVIVVESALADRSFAYAGDALPFGADELRASAAPGERELRIFEGAALAGRVEGAAPLALDDLDLVLRRGLERLADRHGL